ncbi:hypothetical protein SSX86_025539 [Deinandra increscens subsp. villosa]|uniref:Uncharacterized protein n=1 Tax=Deinandra increscens subsp. villosa TaxID=3103831 RepID=A0AAP0CD83_9ASTR
MHSSRAPNFSPYLSHPSHPSSPEPPSPEISAIPMESTIKIIRTSIHTFLQHYTYFTSAAILALPFSAAILLSSSSSLLRPEFEFVSLHSRLRSLFEAGGFPPESEFFSILNLKFSQTISCFVLTLPFSLSFLLIAKACVIRFLGSLDGCCYSPNRRTHPKKLVFWWSESSIPYLSPPSFSGIFNSILQTQIWNTFLIISANATCFWILFITFNCLENLHIPSPIFTVAGGIAYSVVIANALIITNLALILSGMELSGGFISILKACVLIRGRTSIALLLSLPVNIALAGTEALFEFRIIKACSDSGMIKPNSTMVLEGLFIAYLYSILVIIEAIIGCVFFKSCKIAYDRKIGDQETGGRKEEEEVALVKCLAKDLF